MELDQKAQGFILKAKASGKSKEDTMTFLQSKGYDLGIVEQPPLPTSLTPEQQEQARLSGERAVSKQPNEITRGLTNIARDVGAVLPFEGLQEKAEAGIRAIGKGTYGEELSNIKIDKELWDLEKNITLDEMGLPTWTDEAAEIAGGISSGAIIGKFLGLPKVLAGMSKLGTKAVDATIGAIEAGTLGNNPLSYVVGGTVGLVAPELVEGAVKGVSKLSNKISKPLNELVTNMLTKTKGKSITKLASDDKTVAQVLRGIDSSKETAKLYREVSDKALEDTYDRTQRKISKALDIDSIADFGAKAKSQYSDTFTKFKTNKVGKNIYKNDVLKDALTTAKKNDLTGELTDLGDNTLGMAQSVKEVIDDRIAKSYVSKGLAKPQATKETRQLLQIKNDFVRQLDDSFPAYKQVRSDYGKWRQSQNLIDDILKPRGREDANLSSMLLTNKNKALISKTLGKEKLDSFTKTLRDEDNIYRNMKTISTKARNRIQDRGSLGKILGESIGLKSLAAPVAVGATTSPALGVGVLGAEILGKGARDIYRGGIAKDLIQGTEQLDPFVKAIMAQQLGKATQ